jgi:hypothetical protein
VGGVVACTYFQVSYISEKTVYFPFLLLLLLHLLLLHLLLLHLLPLKET